jgi:Xaa-Pro aminopeptidase
MVVTVEPGIYLPGTGGVRLEEMVVIEKSGPRILTKNSRYYDF